MKPLVWIRFGRRKFTGNIRNYLKQGISHHRLALSLSLGITIGIIPFYGLTTFIISLIVIGLRLNFAAAQLAHYIVHPIQIALFVPFFKLGELFHNDALPGSIKQFIHLIKTDFWGTVHDFWMANLSAIAIWLIIAIPLGIILYRIFRQSIKRYAMSMVG